MLDLIEQIDDDLVLTADVAREHLMVTVYQGREVGLYSDPRDELDDEDDEFEDGPGDDEGTAAISVRTTPLLRRRGPPSRALR